MMTQSEFQRIETLLRVCASNIARCQQIATRSSVLVEGAKKLVEDCQKTLRDKEADTLKSVKLSRQVRARLGNCWQLKENCRAWLSAP
jgi:hypothetical protein